MGLGRSRVAVVSPADETSRCFDIDVAIGPELDVAEALRPTELILLVEGEPNLDAS